MADPKPKRPALEEFLAEELVPTDGRAPADVVMPQVRTEPADAVLRLSDEIAISKGAGPVATAAATQEQLGVVPKVEGGEQSLIGAAWNALTPQTLATWKAKDASAARGALEFAGRQMMRPGQAVLNIGADTKKYVLDPVVDAQARLAAEGRRAGEALRTGETPDLASLAVEAGRGVTVPLEAATMGLGKSAMAGLSHAAGGIPSVPYINPLAEEYLVETESLPTYALRVVGGVGTGAGEIAGRMADAAGLTTRSTRGRTRTYTGQVPFGQFAVDWLQGVERGEGMMEVGEAVARGQGLTERDLTYRLLQDVGALGDVVVPGERIPAAPLQAVGAVRQGAELARTTGAPLPEAVRLSVAERLPTWLSTGSVVDIGQTVRRLTAARLADAKDILALPGEMPGDIFQAIVDDGRDPRQTAADVADGDAAALEYVADLAGEAAVRRARASWGVGDPSGTGVEFKLGDPSDHTGQRIRVTEKEAARLHRRITSDYAPSLAGAGVQVLGRPEGIRARAEVAARLGMDDLDVTDPMTWQETLLPALLREEVGRSALEQNLLQPYTPSFTAMGARLRDATAEAGRIGAEGWGATAAQFLSSFMTPRPSMTQSYREMMGRFTRSLEVTPEEVARDATRARAAGLGAQHVFDAVVATEDLPTPEAVAFAAGPDIALPEFDAAPVRDAALRAATEGAQQARADITATAEMERAAAATAAKAEAERLAARAQAARAQRQAETSRASKEASGRYKAALKQGLQEIREASPEHPTVRAAVVARDEANRNRELILAVEAKLKADEAKLEVAKANVQEKMERAVLEMEREQREMALERGAEPPTTTDVSLQRPHRAKFIDRLRLKLKPLPKASDVEVAGSVEASERVAAMSADQAKPTPEFAVPEASPALQQVRAQGGIVGATATQRPNLTPARVVATALDLLSRQPIRGMQALRAGLLYEARDAVRRALNVASDRLHLGDRAAGQAQVAYQAWQHEKFRDAMRRGETKARVKVQDVEYEVNVDPAFRDAALERGKVAAFKLVEALGLNTSRAQLPEVPTDRGQVLQAVLAEHIGFVVGEDGKGKTMTPIQAASAFVALDELSSLAMNEKRAVLGYLNAAMGTDIPERHVAHSGPDVWAGILRGLKTPKVSMAELQAAERRVDFLEGAVAEGRAALAQARDDIALQAAEALEAEAAALVEEAKTQRREARAALRTRLRERLKAEKGEIHGKHKAEAEAYSEQVKAKARSNSKRRDASTEAITARAEAERAAVTAERIAREERIRELLRDASTGALQELSELLDSMAATATLKDATDGVARLLVSADQAAHHLRSFVDQGLLDADVAEAALRPDVPVADRLAILARASEDAKRGVRTFARDLGEAFTGKRPTGVLTDQGAARIVQAWWEATRDGGAALHRALAPGGELGAAAQHVADLDEGLLRLGTIQRQRKKMARHLQEMADRGLAVTLEQFAKDGLPQEVVGPMTEAAATQAARSMVELADRADATVAVRAGRLVVDANAALRHRVALRYFERIGAPTPRLSGRLVEALEEGGPEGVFIAASIMDELRTAARRGLIPEGVLTEDGSTRSPVVRAAASWLGQYKMVTILGLGGIRTPAFLLGNVIGYFPQAMLRLGLRGAVHATSMVATPAWRRMVNGLAVSRMRAHLLATGLLKDNAPHLRNGLSAEFFTDDLGVSHSYEALLRAVEDHNLESGTVRVERAEDLVSKVRAALEPGLDIFRAEDTVLQRLAAAYRRMPGTKQLGRALGGVTGAVGWWHQTMFEIAHMFDMGARLAVFLGEVKQGRSYEHAASEARAAMLDYSDMSDFERFTLRKVVPFWAFERKNLDAHLWSLFRDPSRVARLARLQKVQWDEEEWRGMRDHDLLRFKLPLGIKETDLAGVDPRYHRSVGTTPQTVTGAFIQTVADLLRLPAMVAPGGWMAGPSGTQAAAEVWGSAMNRTIPPVRMVGEGLQLALQESPREGAAEWVRTGGAVPHALVELDDAMFGGRLADALDIRAVPTTDPRVRDGVYYAAFNVQGWVLFKGTGGADVLATAWERIAGAPRQTGAYGASGPAGLIRPSLVETQPVVETRLKNAFSEDVAPQTMLEGVANRIP